ncbi:multidrug efflux transporter AcrB transmembrane domain-containing protein [Dothidotthia symphoricarpi CBS 119687]|uniref:Multidrug efflux transporter AcrB transmembrane domain-containing protein n=1 Tax=Dothidotthia symphoricarpi CBS 119687 TaxID=1392245 RepID=A0A6A5ZYV7_9PLEO|nr:multidrug efflux transporter AcrB transmembrane domain-containing protein [Dothidotthia symphoricarpi CBS 119687]KAF2124074.1 multidrug efflux transporter AcrB transmembrane domain-containing protein [Dothidotthia symphoricarpi CBS 119687]
MVQQHPRGWRAMTVLSILAGSALAAPDLTAVHEKGRCAMRGHCGKQGFFGSDLPCPDNGLATTPEDDVRQKLVDICGDQWSDTDICCAEEQLDALKSNLNRATPIINACPACKENFYNLFCTFTCSPDQSLFINITDTVPKGDKFLVTELDNLVADEYASTFYDSCKDVKFGATNGKAMDFIGGGAKNYTQFLKFLGDKKFLGSPFQINFPRPAEGDYPDMVAMNKHAYPCDTEDEKYRCACLDCGGSCAELSEVTEDKQCYVGLLPCLSFAVIVVYSVFIALLCSAVAGHVAYQKHSNHKNERLRLLQDLEPSDDEDEGDIVHNVGMLDRPTKHYAINTWCDRMFSRLGYFCAKFPAITISTSIVFVGLLSLGWMRFEVETDPVRLWVSPDSAAAQEKTFFDEKFGPFFRAEQVFLVNETSANSTVLSYETLDWWFGVESQIQRLKSFDNGITLDQVCFKPVGDDCVVQSVSGYFQGDFANVSPDSWQEDLQACVENPAQCLPTFQQPLDHHLLFGGVNESILDAKALVITWVVQNHQEGTPELERAMEFENEMKNFLKLVQDDANNRGLRLSFNTEVSLEQELNKSTNTDAKIVVISYIIMFLYASLALGSTTLTVKSVLRNPANALVQSKFMLGIVGILIVLMSVSASVGLFSAAGIKVTLIIAEVIPFLVLAVGVDNIFLIVHEFERINISHPEGEIPERISRALGRMGPSILLSALTETTAFALGCAVGMPAVRNFAAYAAGAVFINAILQVTMFIAVLALNQRRVESNRADCFPCVRVSRADSGYLNGGMGYGAGEESTLQRFIRKTYAPALLGKKTKVGVLALFFGIFTAGVALFPMVELGLDQRIAIPSDSYLIPYFNDLYDYLDVGPPVYFVTKELDVTKRKPQKELCGRFSTCDQDSLANVIEAERKRPEVSFLAASAANWLDDFFLWLNPENEKCCVDDKGKPCFQDRTPAWNMTLSGMPEGEEFIHYLERWIDAPTTEECPIGGKAAYSDALVIDSKHLTIPASHFRTSHTPLRSQEDFIAAYTAARRISREISQDVDTEVFPYSKFYIFFDQYTTIVRLAGALIGSALAAVLVITTILLGSIATGLIVTLVVAMTVSAIIGSMAVMGVSLNAVSLVNLIICVGISVEFTAHIARAFTFPSRATMEKAPRHRFRGRDARAWTAMVNVASSVVSGITITKILGVGVLAFTRSKIFEIYYFRVWVALVLWASTHALILLPVLLSLVGGKGYVDPESEGGLEQDLRRRQYPALLGDDDEEYDSDA